jgi:hypothetical protein
MLVPNAVRWPWPAQQNEASGSSARLVVWRPRSVPSFGLAENQEASGPFCRPTSLGREKGPEAIGVHGQSGGSSAL